MEKKESPYDGVNLHEYSAITKKLIDSHPLRSDEIVELCEQTWSLVWSTKIGTNHICLSLRDINPPATIIGYFFEKIFCKLLNSKYPHTWRNGKQLDEKDVVNIKFQEYSFEIKTSGQFSTKIYGNRSYGKKIEGNNKKDKSGYYLTINFFKDKLELIRFGWIDHSDWASQKSESGQQSHLNQTVYDYKLKILKGDYLKQTDNELLFGKSKKINLELKKLGLTCFDIVDCCNFDFSNSLKNKINYIKTLIHN